MNETEFQQASEAVLQHIEQVLDVLDEDIDYARNGAVLEIEFADRSKLIINQHLPNREIWVAHRSGGYHFSYNGTLWQSTRDGEELFALLSRLLGQQLNRHVVF